MSAESTIEIERASTYTDRARAYKVMIDGQEVGRVRNNTTESFTVAPGTHDVMLKIDWAMSPTVTVDVPPGATARLKCRPRANPLTVLYYATLGRKSYLRLEPVT